MALLKRDRVQSKKIYECSFFEKYHLISNKFLKRKDKNLNTVASHFFILSKMKANNMNNNNIDSLQFNQGLVRKSRSYYSA